MQDRFCTYCNTIVYCAENTCDCPWTVRIQSNPQKDWKRERPTQQKTTEDREVRIPIQRFQETNNHAVNWKTNFDKQLHPFRNAEPAVWEQFWSNAPYIGRSKFRRDSDEYDHKRIAMHPKNKNMKLLDQCHWYQVDPDDMSMVLQRSNASYNTEAFVTINIKKTQPDLVIPKQETEGSAGFDLRTPIGFKLLPGESTVIPVGFSMQILKGYFRLNKPRSSMAKIGLTTDAGVIDQDYTGEIMVIVINRNKSETVEVDKRDRIAQIIILPYLPAKLTNSRNRKRNKRIWIHRNQCSSSQEDN